jgi:hypothetical protein
MKIHNRFGVAGFTIACMALLVISQPVYSGGFVEKSFSCKVETKVEVVVGPGQEGAEFTVDDCYCWDSLGTYQEEMKIICESQAEEAVAGKLTLDMVKSKKYVEAQKTEFWWKRYKLVLGEKDSVSKTAYCATFDQVHQYVATCVEQVLGR